MMGKGKGNTTKGVLACVCLLVLMWLFGFATLAYTAEPPENILKNGDFDLMMSSHALVSL